ncbi:MAG: chorion class high-cysteine HCB protein 13 [Lachnospiraceae bacterium]|nr:chorion class high-cysteine HCB protein 13 [Lachnospiraceae bacterium]
MSDLAATNCGGGCSFNDNDNRCGCGNLIWILILLFCCGNGSFFGGDCDNGCGNNSCLWILILLFCCGGFGGGCGC